MLFVTSKHSGSCAQNVGWRGRWVCLRPAGSDDARRYADFRASLDTGRINAGTLALLPDGATLGRSGTNGEHRNFTFVAVLDDAAGTLLGIARAIRCARGKAANVAIVLRPDVEGQGLGRLLMGKLVTDCRASDLLELAGETSFDNRRMIELARAFRFVDTPSAEPGIVSLRLKLRESLHD